MRYLFALLIVLSAAGASWGQSDKDTAVIVQLKSASVVVKGLKVRMKDVAEISTYVAEGGNERVSNLRACVASLGRFQSGTSSLVLSHDNIRSALVKSGFAADNVAIQGPEQVRVSRKMLRVSNRRILDMARRHVRGALAGIDEKATITFAGHIQPVNVPSARWSSEIRIEGDPENRRYLGRVNLRLVAELDGSVEVLSRIPVVVTRRVLAIRMARKVKKGSILKRADLSLEEREVSRLGDQLFFQLSDVTGMVARRDLMKGDDVLRGDLKSTPVIHKDDLITVRVRSGVITVETMCLARQSGGVGEHILVQNIESKGEFTAVVVDAKTAEIRPKK